MTSIFALAILSLAISGNFLRHVDAMKVFCPMAPLSRHTGISLSPTALHAGNNNRWWDGENISEESKVIGERQQVSSSYEQQYKQYGTSEKQNQPSLITREMEEEVMASASATMDSNTVSRTISSLIDSKSNVNTNRGGNVPNYNEPEKKSKNSLRDLALSTMTNDEIQSSSINNTNNQSKNSSSSSNNNSWDTQQIAIASGATTFLLSPLIIPIIHSLLPPLIPSPSSISFTGAALLGTVSYIVALGDPADQSNSVLGDGVEVGGAVSRIVGRTALQSVQTSAPRLKAAARAMVDYDSTTATLEDLQRVQRQLSQTVLEVETENDALRKEVALWQAVEDVSSMYKLEELKEMARYEGIKGYSTDGKNALLRRLVKERILKLDLSPYY